MWQIKKFYKKKFMIGMRALDIIHAQFGIQMDEHEASLLPCILSMQGKTLKE
ncbi:transcription antiterminator licT [Paenibacillus terrae HPL-003]|uniref:Transcription antiterminator licT n=1 Tax=Paenibacillus terrae (strain HPL-003) TaxID=985665 RepID=G7W2F5_PAETH|nr:transcription antiterminator licT [Paenibacillus terrae HPL-003]